MFKKIFTFRPSFTVRILTGLFSFLLLLSVCTVIYVADVGGNLSKRDVQFRSRQIEQGARFYKEQCARCHGPEGKGVEGIAPGISNANFIGKLKYGEIDGQRVLETETPSPRLKELGYSGTLRDYIRSVVSSGIPIKSSNEWDAPHPPFSEKYGGPMRDDQIENITFFVMNWGLAPYADGEAIMPAVAGGAPKATAVPLTPEQEAGRDAYNKLGCNACHAIRGQGNQGAVGPSLNKIGAVAEERIASDQYKSTVKDQPAATTAEAYVIQAIHYPNAHIVEKCPQGPCAAGVMTQNFKDTIPADQFKSLVAYLLSLK
jgi:mono/diheme cytochrome c family protein